MLARDVEKDEVMEVEVACTDKAGAEDESKGDYSGAVAKTDKVEIALVKKLDRRILPVLWAMYFLYAVKCFSC